MISLYVEFFEFYIFPLTYRSYILGNVHRYISGQDPKSILGCEDNMIITLVYYMRQLPVFAHIANIKFYGVALHTLPPSKTVDF